MARSILLIGWHPAAFCWSAGVPGGANSASLLPFATCTTRSWIIVCACARRFCVLKPEFRNTLPQLPPPLPVLYESAAPNLACGRWCQCDSGGSRRTPNRRQMSVGRCDTKRNSSRGPTENAQPCQENSPGVIEERQRSRCGNLSKQDADADRAWHG